MTGGNVEFTRMQLKEQPLVAPAQIEAAAPPRRRITPSLVGWMILAGFLSRFLYVLVAHSYRFRTNDANSAFGWEIGRSAYSIPTRRRFSCPFGGETGPSACTAPVYPYIVALSFRLFGIYSHAAAIALLGFNSLC